MCVKNITHVNFFQRDKQCYNLHSARQDMGEGRKGLEKGIRYCGGQKI